MTDIAKLREDVAYVRAAAFRSEGVPIRSICVLWAVIILIGFTLNDFALDKRWIGWFWMVAAPGGFILSMWFGIRAGNRAGQADHEEGMRIFKHWLAFLVAGVLGGLQISGGHLTYAGLGSLWVLLLALSYFHAGLHYDRRLVPVGIVTGLCYPITIFLPDFGWTASGIIIAAALTVQAFLGQVNPNATD